jgi:hypothetical protein
MKKIIFDRGPDNEIIVPPLLDWITLEEAVRRFFADNLALGAKLPPPRDATERRYQENLALLYCHQMRLRGVIGGALRDETPFEKALRQAVLAGERLSLRPPGGEALKLPFVPILQRLELDSELWQIGLPGRGQWLTFRADPKNVIEKAQQMYVDWCAAENTPGSGS